MSAVLADDYFAGAGGWDLGALRLGIHARGIEKMPAARATRAANGLETIHDDVWTYQPDGTASLQITSPPCPTFSQAGKGAGRANLHHVLEAIRVGAWRSLDRLQELAERIGGEDGQLTALVLTPLHFAVTGGYSDLAWEQVPPVLPVWQACARELWGEGFNVWTGYVHSEQYGVPQTRKRAALIASRNHPVHHPLPTHSKFHNRTPERLDRGVLKWVSMAEALWWGEDDLVGFPRLADTDDLVVIDGKEYRARDLRSGRYPAQALTEKTRSWTRFAEPFEGADPAEVRYVNGTHEHAARRAAEHPAPTVMFGQRANTVTWQRDDVPEDAMLCPTNLRPNAALRRQDQPAPTMAFGHEQPRWVTPQELAEYRERVAAEVEPRVNNQSGSEYDNAWPADRPAPTVAGRGLVGMPGSNANRFNGSSKSRNDGVRVTVAEAGVLQSFPADYDWQGGKSMQYLQAGNAVPPGMAAPILAVATGMAEPPVSADVALF